MSAPRAVAVAALFLAAGSAGCLGLFEEDAAAAPDDVDLARLVGNRTAEAIEARVALVPRNYTFPDQRAMPTVTLWKNGTIDSSALAAYEDRNDRGGNRWGVVVLADDYSGVIPAGQPVELRVKLSAQMQPGASADLDIWVDVPGTRSDWDPTSQDEFNWKFTSKSTSVSTIGVAGAKHEVGVAVANGRVLPGSSLAYTLEVEITYLKDVLAPAIPWAFDVPENATGLVVQSVKGSGPEHIRAKFVVLGPDDEPLAVVDFNDIAIPSQSVFVPVKAPGTHVFYAWEMTGGFLDLQADVPVPMRNVRALTVVETPVAITSAPAPGLPARDWTHQGTATPGVNGGTTSFSVTGTFPLAVLPTIGDGATGASEVRISNGNGLVASLQRVARVDQGDDSLGYTQDRFNAAFHPERLAKGEYAVEFTNDSPTTEIGYVVRTYARE